MTSYTSVPRKHTAETAQTMSDVRYEVDRLDRGLVEILAERQTFMDAAARIKPKREAVRDEPRIEQVVSNVLEACKECGLAPEIAEPVWRLLIEQSIAYEFNSYDNLKKPDTRNS
ncbi:MAG TPA: chorismate mutase [Hyphomonadaceae bacterium]|nr:chorismate mutase [Hyphomonadaceae bacterium]